MNIILAQMAAIESSVVFAVFGVFAVGVAILAVRLLKQSEVVRTALRGSDGQSLEELLKKHLEAKDQLAAKLEELSRRVGELEQHALLTKGNLGVIRYDAFDDVSGKNSFALAIKNEEGDGVVLNSIAGRDTARLYCKPVIGGRSEHLLSPEEEEALRLAAKTPARQRDK